MLKIAYLFILQVNLKFQLYDLFFSFDKNIGKGGAVKKGLELSQGKYVMFQDADLEYDPIEIVKFFKIINMFHFFSASRLKILILKFFSL